MKNYDEIARSVLEKRDCILNRRAERRKKVFGIASPMAALCLAVMIGIGVSQAGSVNDDPLTIGGDTCSVIGDDRVEAANDGGTYPAIWNEIYGEDGYMGGGKNLDEQPYPHTTAEQDDLISAQDSLMLVEVTTSSYILSDPISTVEIDSAPADSSYAVTDIYQSDPDEIHSGVAEGLFYINSIIGEATPAKRVYNKEDHYGIDYSAEEMEAYIGIDMESIMSQLPDDMVYIPHKHNVIMKTDGNIVYDAAHFMIEDGKGGRITISAGRELPPYDSIYMLKSEGVSELETDKGSVSILAGGKDYDEDKGAFGFFFADFEYDGVYYRIEIENIYREKIIAVLFKLILG